MLYRTKPDYNTKGKTTWNFSIQGPRLEQSCSELEASQAGREIWLALICMDGSPDADSYVCFLSPKEIIPTRCEEFLNVSQWYLMGPPHKTSLPLRRFLIANGIIRAPSLSPEASARTRCSQAEKGLPWVARTPYTTPYGITRELSALVDPDPYGRVYFNLPYLKDLVDRVEARELPLEKAL
jgi:hypothetical protein